MGLLLPQSGRADPSPGNWSNAFWIATSLASIVVFFELWAIAYIRTRYMDTPLLQAVF
jgi:hypothetical protein